MLNSFRWKMILPSVLLAVLLPLLFHVTWQNWYIRDMERTIEQQWTNRLQYVEQLHTQSELLVYVRYLIETEEMPEGTYIDIFNADISMVWSSDPASYEARINQYIAEFRPINSSTEPIFPNESTSSDELSEGKSGQKPILPHRLQNFYFTVPIDLSGETQQYVQLTYPMDFVIMDKLALKQRIVWGMVIVFALMGVTVGVNLWRTISLPIFQVVTIAQKVKDGQYEHRIHVQKKDEFGRLAQVFNQMIQSIREKVTELSDEKSKLEGVLNNMLSGVLLINIKGQVRYANPSAERILHANRDSLVFKSYQEVLDSYGLSSKIEAALTNGEFYRDQIRLENQLIPQVVEVSIVPIRNINRLINSVIVVIHDISEIKRLEQVRAEFVANVSHELKTPVTSIKGFAETILDGNADDKEEMIEFTRIIYKEAGRLSNLIHDLLELSKLEANDANIYRQNEDVVEIAREVINNLQYEAAKKSREIKLYANRERIVHVVNRDRIKQVFINLISNSIAYSKVNTIIFIRIFDNDHDVVIEVEDQGIGIPESDLPRIFERFYRVQKDRSRATGGTGLGLSIVKHIVEIHEGKIEVDSKVGVGTTFRIAFPKR